MLRVAPQKDKSKTLSRRRVKYVGLLADARTLGVHRNHLYMVLSGRRRSVRLMQAYYDLQEQKAEQAGR